MLGVLTKIFKKQTSSADDTAAEAYDAVVTTYTGEVLSADFTAESLGRDEINNYGYPHHNLLPHGQGHIVYTLYGEVLEEYQGQFDIGQYHGQGKLYFKETTFEGTFDQGIFKKDVK